MLLIDFDIDESKDMTEFGLSLFINVILNFAFFTTYPTYPEDHCMMRSRTTGFKFLMVVQFILPIAFVGTAVGAKSLVKMKHLGEENPELRDEYRDNKLAERVFCWGLAFDFLLIYCLALFHSSGMKRHLRDIWGYATYYRHKEGAKAVGYFIAKVFSVAALFALGLFGNHLSEEETLYSGALIATLQAILVAVENVATIVAVSPHSKDSKDGGAPGLNKTATGRSISIGMVDRDAVREINKQTLKELEWRKKMQDTNAKASFLDLDDTGIPPATSSVAEAQEVAAASVASPLPSGWSYHVDPSSGDTYYMNSASGETSWKRPTISTAPPGSPEMSDF